MSKIRVFFLPRAQTPDFEAHNLKLGRLALSSAVHPHAYPYPRFTTQDIVIERDTSCTASFKERRREVQASLPVLPIS